MSSDLINFHPLTDQEKKKLTDYIFNTWKPTPGFFDNKRPVDENVFEVDQHKIDFKQNAKKNRAKRLRRKRKK